MPNDDLIWNAHARALSRHWQSWTRSNRLPGLVLLCGPAGVGKHELMNGLAKRLLCLSSPFQGGQSLDPQGLPCGTCTVCLQLESGQKIDWQELGSTEDDVLKIDTFRAVREQMGRSSFQGKLRVFTIASMERMNQAAANSVLKLFEEPPNGWIFLATTNDTDRLPVTVVSRSYVIRIAPLSDSILQELLVSRGHLADQVEMVVPWSLGSLLRAESFLNEDFYPTFCSLMSSWQRTDQWVPLAWEWSQKDDPRLDRLLDVVEQLLTREWKNHDPSTSSGPTTQMQPRFTTPQLEAALDRIFLYRRRRDTPVNQKLLIQQVLGPLLGV